MARFTQADTIVPDRLNVHWAESKRAAALKLQRVLCLALITDREQAAPRDLPRDHLLLRLDDFLLGDLRLEVLRLEALREVLFLRGTLAPERRASDRPMAMACLRLVTLFFDLAPFLSVPRLRSRIDLATFF